MNVQDTLEQQFGLPGFLPGQRTVIDALLAGRSAAAIFPTGGGKSLCYQLTALHLDGLTLVVSPLIALMKDQIDALARKGIAAARLDSSLDHDEYIEVMGRIRDGSLKLLYVAPERFNNERFRAQIRTCDVAMMAIDEAHCISEWGHNFRPDYLKLARYADELGVGRVLALTATATDRVLADICRGFDIEDADAVRTPFYRPNLTLNLRVVEQEQRDAVLLDLLTERPPGPTIIYVTLQKTAENLAQRLTQRGLPASAYHAGLKPEIRGAVQDRFMASERDIVVATIAFGMGIDKADIRYVIHHNPPKSLENYAQEIGRAGRDGNPSTCDLLLCGTDLNPLENFIYGDTPTQPAIRSLLDHLFDDDDDLELALNQLSRDCDVRILVLKTLLTQLELDDYLRAGTPVYNQFKFKPLTSSANILGQVDPAHQPLFTGIFRSVTPKRVWMHLDVDAAVNRTGADRKEVLRALDWLSDQQLIELQTSQVRHRYQVLKRPDDRDALAAQLHAQAEKREAAELDRLREVVDLATLDTCQVSALGAHFGQALDAPCGHCTACLGTGTPQATPSRPHGSIAPSLASELQAVRNQGAAQAEALADPRAVARYLCGVRSPALSRAKLTRGLFGRLSDVPFAEVMRWASASEQQLGHQVP